MFAIVVPGKVSSMNLRFPSATDALKKYREMKADGLQNIDLRDAKGNDMSAEELEQQASAETEEQPS